MTKVCDNADSGRASTSGLKRTQMLPFLRTGLTCNAAGLSHVDGCEERLLSRALVLFWCGALAIGQTPTVFQSKVNLVLVLVVVRDQHGRAVGDLTQRDFQLFDNGKLQTISTFSAIRHERSVPSGSAAASTANAQAAPSENGTARPARNFIYVFDDLNIQFADLARLRAAASGYFKNHFSTGDRAAIYTLTGKHSLDFTSDRDQLEAAVSQLRWGTVAGHGGMTCPDVSYYIADLVINKADSQALGALTNYTAECAHVRPEVARAIAMGASYQKTMIGRDDTQRTLSTLQLAVRQLSQMPGERVIVFASPGFFAQTPEGIRAAAHLLQFAAGNHVIIEGLSVRGVIVAEEEEDIGRHVNISRRRRRRHLHPTSRGFATGGKARVPTKT